MKECRIVILGASGLVGRELLYILERESFPAASVKLLGKSHAGERVKFKGEELIIEKVSADSFLNSDIIFGCLGKDETEKYLPQIIDSGAYFIDNSSLLRLNENVPLVIPEINSDRINKGTRLIANPNCSTIIVSLALFPIVKKYRLKRMEVTSFQAVSGAGKGALEEYMEEIKYYPPCFDEKPKFFQETILGNVIPQIGKATENLYTDEEMKMTNEMRKIFGFPKLKVSCTAVRVPVARCHSFSVTATFYEEIPLGKISALWGEAPFIREYTGSYFPSPLKAERSLKVSVGRLRRNLNDKNAFSFFISGDQLLRGAAGNSFLTAKYIAERLL